MLYNLDIMVSNPPYIPESQKAVMDRNVTQFEPHTALFVPDQNPLVFYRGIAAFGIIHLKHGGLLYVEIHEDLAARTGDLMKEYGFSGISVRRDLNGKERMLKCRKP
jgi:release factor glutamine methyltransferase